MFKFLWKQQGTVVMSFDWEKVSPEGADKKKLLSDSVELFEMEKKKEEEEGKLRYINKGFNL